MEIKRSDFGLKTTLELPQLLIKLAQINYLS